MAVQTPTVEITPERIDLLRKGFQGLRKGALYFIVITILGIIVYAGLLTGILLSGRAFEASALGDIVFSSLGVIGILMGIIALMGLIEWMNAGRYFREYDPFKLKYGYTGPRLVLYGVIILLIGVIAAGLTLHMTRHMIGLAAVFALLLIIGAILAFVGMLLFGIFLIQLDELSATGLAAGGFKIAGILWIVGIFINILYIISVILVYVYSGDTLRRLASR